MNDPIGDMLTRIRNAQMRGKTSVSTPASKLRAWVLDVLIGEGYIRGYSRSTDERGHPQLDIELKYADGRPVIQELKRVSTPGRRVYMGVRDAASTWACATCRRCARGSACRSCRRRRA